MYSLTFDFFTANEDDVHLAAGAAERVMIDEHLVDRERDVVLCLEHHHVVDIPGRHLGDLNLLDDQLAPADGDGRLEPSDARLDHRLLDRVSHGLGVADRAVGDGVGGQANGGHPGDGSALDLHGFDGARADIQTKVSEVLRSFFKMFNTLFPLSSQ